jgi:hypothetical protein
VIGVRQRDVPTPHELFARWREAIDQGSSAASFEVTHARQGERGGGHAVRRVVAMRGAKVVGFQWFDDCGEAFRAAGMGEDA